jgi:hypothetical protein
MFNHHPAPNVIVSVAPGEDRPSSPERHPSPGFISAQFRTMRIYRPHQPRPRHPARAHQLPWFRCKKCGARIAQMDVIDGRTAVRIGRCYEFYAEIICPRCGRVREFVSVRAL